MSDPTSAAVDQAIAWMVRLQSGEARAQDWDEWKSWQSAAPDHAQAWERIQAIQGRLAGLPTGASSHTFEHARRDVSRRRAMQLLGVAGAVGVGGWLGLPVWNDVGLLADLRTATGERRRHVLADGSTLWLDTDSAVDVAFDENERRLTLRRGRMLITTGEDSGAKRYRPLTVHTREGSARALGTRFSVRREGAVTEVAVMEHAVELRGPKAEANAPATVLRAGQRAAMDDSGIGAILAGDADADAWTDGLLVARDMRLDEFAAALGRYRHGHLGCDPKVAEMRVSGVFPLQDTEAALALLTRTRPVRTRALTRYWVTLVSR